MRVAKSYKGPIRLIPILIIALQSALPSAAQASGKTEKPIPLTHSIKAQLIDICEALGEGDMPSFKQGHISTHAMIYFCYTYAMRHTPANPTGLHRMHIPAAEMQRIAYRFFGEHFTNPSLDQKDTEPSFRNGFYDGYAFDPDQSPGGYKVVRIVPLGHQLYRALVNSIDVEPTHFTEVELTVRRSTADGKAHFIVIDYSGDSMNGTKRG